MQGWERKSYCWLILCCAIFIVIQSFRLPPKLWIPEFNTARSVLEVPEATAHKETAGGGALSEKTGLWWENQLGFQNICLKNKVPLRLIAFKISNPDALPAEEHNVRLAAELIKGQVVPPGGVFSTNATLGPRTGDRKFQKGLTYFGTEQIYTFGGGICRLASALYNGAILANLEVIERWSHSMSVPYVPPGQDATIATYKDLKFRNSTPAPLLIWSEFKDTTLYLAFYGQEKPPKVKWHHETLARWPFTTEYRPNFQLKPGEERIVSPGTDGLRVRSWVTIEEPGGERRLKMLGIDTYYPKRQVVEVNPLTFRQESATIKHNSKLEQAKKGRVVR